jgi:hypothetical protein
MPDSRAIGVVSALGADHVTDHLGNQLGQHPEPDADASSPSFAAPDQLAQRLLHALEQCLELAVADLVGPVV